MDVGQIVLAVVIAILMLDKWISRVSCASQREEWQSAFREGGRNYIEGYKLAWREFKTRNDDE